MNECLPFVLSATLRPTAVGAFMHRPAGLTGARRAFLGTHAGVTFDMKQSKYKKLSKLLDKFEKDKVGWGMPCRAWNASGLRLWSMAGKPRGQDCGCDDARSMVR